MKILMCLALALAGASNEVIVSSLSGRDWSASTVLVDGMILPCDGGVILSNLDPKSLVEVKYRSRGQPDQDSLTLSIVDGQLQFEPDPSTLDFQTVTLSDGSEIKMPTLSSGQLVLPWGPEVTKLKIKVTIDSIEKVVTVMESSLIPVPVDKTPADYNPVADVNGDGKVDAVDIQLVINSALGLISRLGADVNGDGKVDAVDIQLVINAALGLDIGQSFNLMTTALPLSSGVASPAGRHYLAGTSLDFQVLASPSYVFQSWTGLPNQGDCPQTIAIRQDLSVRANFVSLPVVTGPNLALIYNESKIGQLSVLLDLREFSAVPTLDRFGVAKNVDQLERFGLLLSVGGSPPEVWEDYRGSMSAEVGAISRIFLGHGVGDLGQIQSLSISQSVQISLLPYVMVRGDPNRHYLIDLVKLPTTLNGQVVSIGSDDRYLLDLPATKIPLVIVDQSPTTVEVNTGQSIRLFVTPGGKAPFSFQWEKAGLTLPDYNTEELFIPSAKVSHSGIYRCLVTDGYQKKLLFKIQRP